MFCQHLVALWRRLSQPMHCLKVFHHHPFGPGARAKISFVEGAMAPSSGDSDNVMLWLPSKSFQSFFQTFLCTDRVVLSIDDKGGSPVVMRDGHRIGSFKVLIWSCKASKAIQPFVKLRHRSGLRATLISRLVLKHFFVLLQEKLLKCRMCSHL